MAEKLWTDAKTLFFHFATTGGLAASLPMTRVFRTFDKPFVGVPGTIIAECAGKHNWNVPGYKCPNCAKTFFAAKPEDLKHACMNDGGIISDSLSMGI